MGESMVRQFELRLNGNDGARQPADIEGVDIETSAPLFENIDRFLTETQRHPFVLEKTMSAGPLFAQSARVQNVASKNELTSLLSTLGPEQYALVFFSLEGCPGCGEYSEQFEDLAREGDGKYLFIKAEGEWTVEDMQVLSYPSVYIFDRRMNMYEIGDIDNVMDEMSQFSVELTDRLRLLRERLDDFDVQSRRSALIAYERLAEGGDIGVMLEALGIIEETVDDQEAQVYIPAGQLYVSMLQAISLKFAEDPSILLENLDGLEKKELEAMRPDVLSRYLFHPDPELRRIAAALYCMTSLGEAGAASEIERVRELIQMTDIELLSESARRFGGLAELLDVRRRSEAEQAFLNEVTPQAIRYELAAAYVNLFRQLDAARQMKEIEEIIKMSHAGSDNVAHAVTVIILALGLAGGLTD